MVCKKPSWWTRLTQSKNRLAECLASHLHMVMPAEGIYGEVFMFKKSGTMSEVDLDRLLADIKKKY